MDAPRRQQEQHGDRVEQQRRDEDELPHNGLVVSAKQPRDRRRAQGDDPN